MELARNEKKAGAEQKASELVSEAGPLSDLLYSVQKGIGSIYSFIIEERERRAALKRLGNALDLAFTDVDAAYKRAGLGVRKDVHEALQGLRDIYSLGVSEIEEVSARNIPLDEKLALFKDIIAATEMGIGARVELLKARIEGKRIE
ncbi:MAG: hypothetical protein N3H30_02505 [Candidatus Micrarchaeota archaeon]|nr:hypothetical protein [Candidatus Micrarchaeota archaeon]